MTQAEAELWRLDFPALAHPRGELGIAYLDSAATAQKPQRVIDAVAQHYSAGVGNPHRGLHEWAHRTTLAYEAARANVAAFLGATDASEIVFTRNGTEALNLLASSLSLAQVRARPRVVVSELEHHSNLVPWQALCEREGAELAVLPIDGSGDVELDKLETVVNERTALVAICHVSNVLGSVLPVEHIATHAHRVGAWCVVDGVQAAPHLPVDVRALGCDAYVVSGHKLYGPCGIGAIWARAEHWAKAPPWQYGGDMVTRVTLEEAQFREPPHRFEAGSPPVAGAVGMSAAIDYLRDLGHAVVMRHERRMLDLLLARLQSMEGARVLGSPSERVAVVSFVLDGIHPHDIGSLLAQENVAVRTGLHCAEPAIRRFGERATVRASVGLYTTASDIERLVLALARVQELLG